MHNILFWYYTSLYLVCKMNTNGNCHTFPLFLSSINCFLSWCNSPTRPGPSYYWGFTITHRHVTLRRYPLDEWPERSRELYLITQNKHKRQTSKSPAWFEPTFPASEGPQNHALDRAATGTGSIKLLRDKNRIFVADLHDCWKFYLFSV